MRVRVTLCNVIKGIKLKKILGNYHYGLIITGVINTVGLYLDSCGAKVQIMFMLKNSNSTTKFSKFMWRKKSSKLNNNNKQ